nr:site-specific integrase [Methylobacterium sp. Leaf118]
MANAINRLTARKVQSLTTPGRHADGGGLYLNISPSGAKSWVMLFRMGGKRHEMGLGAINSVPLTAARDLASAARQKIASGTNPLTEKREASPPPIPTKAVTFGEVAQTYMADQEVGWKNEAHRKQWRQTLEVQAAAIWPMPVAQISTNDVLDVLRPIWATKSETARRIRGRIERVLDAARTSGHRSGENPARWRGHLDTILPRVKKLKRGHHAAMPRTKLPGFYRYLCHRPELSALALRLTILTAARTGETRGMTWNEIDMAEALWTVPGERMKGGREHRVPLTAETITILEEARAIAPGPCNLVFPSTKLAKLSDMVFLMLLRRGKMGDFTTHGFRSTFRDWVDEETDFPGDVAEAALAHLVGDETERAYRRGDALAKRRHLMEAWANFVCGVSGAERNTRSNSS